MTVSVVHFGDAQSERALHQAIKKSSAVISVATPADQNVQVMVFSGANPPAIVAAVAAQRHSAATQVVLRVPDEHVKRLRAQLPFIPHMASAWIMAASAAPESFAELLLKAAAVAQRRSAAATLREKINRQVRLSVEPDEDYRLRQQQLERSEHYLATLLAQAPQAFIALTQHGEIMAWNTAAERLCGVVAPAALGSVLADVLPPIAAQTVLQMMQEAIDNNQVGSRELELELQRGAPLWVNINAMPLREGEHVLGASISIRDVTERHRVMSLLRASESRYRTLVETLPQLIWTARPDGSVDYFSNQWLEYTGLDPAVQLGTGWLGEVVHPDDRDRVRTHWAGAVQGNHDYDIEYRIRATDGIFRWFKVRGTPIHACDGSITEWFGTATDIEEIVLARDAVLHSADRLQLMVEKEMQRRTAAEQALRRAQKMEAIGNLTGGVAHDFNNILQVIGGNLYLLADRLNNDEIAARRILDTQQSVERASKLTAQLLAFGRRQPLAPEVVNVDRLVQTMGDMFRRTLGDAIELQTSIADGLWNTLVDRSNLESALLNLAINARDAMDGRGRLIIEAVNASFDQDYADAQQDEVAPGQYVMLAVSDNGCGMTPETMDKVFEPFFTTKPEGKGTGLGLSMVYGFVKQSSGHIQIYSERGSGTTFKLYLPRSYEAEDSLADADADQPIEGGAETILVVEDDKAVRAMVVATLTDLGYKPLQAGDAASALAIIESGVPIDLLFTDVVMPGPLKSTELVGKVRERMPDIAVLYTSGYTRESIVHHGRLDAGVELLSKPYSRAALARKIRHVLDRQMKALKTIKPASNEAPLASGSASSATILVCEDEPAIREIYADLLQSKGYDVLLAATGQDALKLSSAHELHLLITDVGLPDMSGLELAKRIQESRPTCAVLIASGRHAPLPTELKNTTFLGKPFGAKELYEAVAASLV